MKIIKKGNKPEDSELEFSCNNCKAVLLAKKGEGRFVFDQRDGDAIVFKCPECSREIWVAARLFK